MVSAQTIYLIGSVALRLADIVLDKREPAQDDIERAQELRRMLVKIAVAEGSALATTHPNPETSHGLREEDEQAVEEEDVEEGVQEGIEEEDG